MKKKLLLMAIILPFVLTSCGDDKDEPKQSLEKQLIGEWVKIDENGSELHYIFNSDYTGKNYILFLGSTSDESNFKWSLNGNKLTLSDPNGYWPTVTRDISIEGDVLHMTINDEQIVLHRVKG